MGSLEVTVGRTLKMWKRYTPRIYHQHTVKTSILHSTLKSPNLRELIQIIIN